MIKTQLRKQLTELYSRLYILGQYLGAGTGAPQVLFWRKKNKPMQKHRFIFEEF